MRPAAQRPRGREEYCGLFRTPTLRNVATRQTFFHNGVVHSLRQAVEFYAERDTNPERWYPKDADGTVAQVRRPAAGVPGQRQHATRPSAASRASRRR